MTDEYEEMSAYIAKLGEELGVKFVKDKDMLSLDDFRYRVLIRENLHNFFIHTKTHFKDVLQIDILDKTALEIGREKHRITAKRWRENNRDKVSVTNKNYENKRQKKSLNKYY